MRLFGNQSGLLATTSPVGATKAASPGKSSSNVEPACVAMATHVCCSTACRRASPKPHSSHQANPARQLASSVRRPCKPGAEQKNTRLPRWAAIAFQVKSTPPSAQMTTPALLPAVSNTFVSSPIR